MSQFELYTPPKPFSTNKWLSIGLASTFVAIAIGATSLTISTVRRSHAGEASAFPAAVIAAPAVTAPAVAAQAPLGATAAAAPDVAAKEAPVATTATAVAHRGKRGRKATKQVLTAKNGHARAFLAKHEIKNKHKRDEIDKLLGL